TAVTCCGLITPAAPRAASLLLIRGPSSSACLSIHDANRGGCIMRRSLFGVLILIMASSRLEAACVDPAAFIQSTVNIARNFNEEGSRASSGVVGIRGTAWFLSPRLLVTAAHVAEAMQLSEKDWKDVEMRGGESTRSVPMRILRLAGSHAEKIA